MTWSFSDGPLHGNAFGVFAAFRAFPPCCGPLNAEALSAMTANNLGAIAVVDQDRRLQGVVEREQLVSKLVLSLASAAEPATRRAPV